MPVKHMTFHMLCDTKEVDVDIAYNTMNKNLAVKVNKVAHTVTSSQNSGRSLFPYKFHNEELNLKFEIDLDKVK